MLQLSKIKNMKVTVPGYFCQNVELSVYIVLLVKSLETQEPSDNYNVFVQHSVSMACVFINSGKQACICPNKCSDNPPRPEICGDGHLLVTGKGIRRSEEVKKLQCKVCYSGH